MNLPFPPTAKPFPNNARPTRELLKCMPQMSLRERDRRWDKARKEMLMGGIDALVFLGNDIYWGMGMANLRYMLQVDSQIGAYAIFPLTGDPVVWNSVVHMNRLFNMYLAVQEWFTDVRTYGGLGLIAEELKSRGLDRSKLGLVAFSSTIQVTPTFLHDDIVNLEKILPHAKFTDASPLLQEMRMVKSEEEIDMLRKAGKVARKVVDAMVNTARPGATEAEVYAEMIRTQIANGGEPNIFNMLASGPVDHPAADLWHLLHGCEQPLTPSMRPLSAGDIVVAEWHTKFGGYRCHTEYSVYLGKKAPKELLDIWGGVGGVPGSEQGGTHRRPHDRRGSRDDPQARRARRPRLGRARFPCHGHGLARVPDRDLSRRLWQQQSQRSRHWRLRARRRHDLRQQHRPAQFPLEARRRHHAVGLHGGPSRQGRMPDRHADRARAGGMNDGGAPPLPACGERVGVRGTFAHRTPAETPHPPLAATLPAGGER